MKKIHVNFDLGMIVGLGILCGLVLLGVGVRLIYGPNSFPEETLEEFILKKYGIDIEFSPKDDTEYEVIIDEENGKKILREKKEIPPEKTTNVQFLPIDIYPVFDGICYCKISTNHLS
ncbi:MAG: hypothetical protein ACE5GV_00235 [Candidatus Scalindua sp.]